MTLSARCTRLSLKGLIMSYNNSSFQRLHLWKSFDLLNHTSDTMWWWPFRVVFIRKRHKAGLCVEPVSP